MASKNCLKISYKGLTRNIICDTNLRYDDILRIVMEKFNIPDSYKIAIEFYDEQGNKYNKDTFEYFLLLFPNPQKIFFIRLDSSKILHFVAATGRQSNDNDRTAFGVSKLNNKIKSEPEVVANTNCEGVPVRRQNCFLGEIPDGATVTQTQNITREFVKRMRLLKQSPPKRKNIAQPNVQKRSMRI